MIDSIAAEWLKFHSLRSNRAFLAVSLLAVLLSAALAFMVARGFDNQAGDARLRFDGIGSGLGAGLPVAYFVLGALGALSITAEHSTGLIRTSLVTEPRRLVFLFAKVPVLAVTGLVAGLVLVYGMHFGTQAVLGWRAGQVVLDGGTLGASLAEPGVLAGLPVAGVSVALVTLVGLGLGAMIRSTAGTLVTLILIVFVLPILAQALPDPSGAVLGSFMIENLPAQIVPGEAAGVLAPLAAVAVLLAYPVAALTGGAVAITLRGRRIRPLLAGAAALALLLSAPVVPAGAVTSTLKWADCRQDLQCATIEVPVDWSKPSGRTISLQVARLPATNRRTGVVFAIPGGPGGSGIDDLESHGGSFAELRHHFDVVSFAPRNTTDLGILPLDCLLDGPTISTLPDTPAAYAELAAGNRAHAERCRAADPEFFDHLDSASVARDIEAIRAALGERRLSFVATSYGGVVGVAYARLFPGNVRAMYLDGAVDLLVSHSDDQKMRYQNIEAQFARFITWCAATSECALHGRDVGALWRGLIAKADRSPVPVRGERVAYSGLDFTVAAAPDVITPGQAPDLPRWRELAQAIAQAAAGDASGFADYVKQGTGRLKVRSTVGMNMTHCPDGMGFDGYDEYHQVQAAVAPFAPNFNGNEMWHPLACAGWPAPVTDPTGPLPADRLPPFLGAGTWTDYADTADIVRRIPGSATVRYDGSGHGLYLTGNLCAIAHANRYLTTLRLPPPGTVCRPPASD
jgi:pimeloyl-ACP methyl ester carboxylesterase